jgi:formylglycine-generating enzyme required for sulfatase activity
VWEWVQDWYDDHHYANSPSVDPTGPSSGSGRVVRGGSWHQTATSSWSAFRGQCEPDYRGISIGFRLALSVDR